MKPPVYHRIFGYDTEHLPNGHLATLEEGVETIVDARQLTGATIGYPGWGLIYHILLSHLDRNREEVLLETGSNLGCTTVVLTQALIDAGCQGNVVTIELEKENVEISKNNFVKAGVESRADIRCGDSRSILGVTAEEIGCIRFAFLDASHLCKDVLFEFETILPFLSDDALVIFDNIYQIAEPGEDQRVNGALKIIKNGAVGS